MDECNSIEVNLENQEHLHSKCNETAQNIHKTSQLLFQYWPDILNLSGIFKPHSTLNHSIAFYSFHAHIKCSKILKNINVKKIIVHKMSSNLCQINVNKGSSLHSLITVDNAQIPFIQSDNNLSFILK